MAKLSLEIIGHLGADAKIKKINELEYISFSVAHTRKIKGESVATWVNVLKRNYAGSEKLLARLKKGFLVAAEGTPTFDVGANNTINITVFSDNIQALTALHESVENDNTEGQN